MYRIACIVVAVLLSGHALVADELDQAQQLFNEKKYSEAAATVQAYLRSNPRNIDALILAGDIYSQLEQPRQALEFYRRAYQEDRDNTLAIRRYGLALSESGDHKQSLEILQRGLRSKPNDVRLRLAYGQALLAADSIRAAELEITKAREMDKTIPDGFLALGDLYFSQRVYLLAKDNYEQALKLDPNNLAAREKLGLVYFRLANAETVDNALANEYYSRSLQQWAAIIERDSMYARAYFEQGKIFFYASRYADAARSLETYVRLRPDAPNATIARWYLAQSLSKLEECEKAEQYLRFAIDSIDSVRTKARLLLARCYFAQRRFADAAAEFRALTAEQPEQAYENIIDRERYGYALILSGDTAQAIVELRAVVDRDSSRCLTMFRLAEIYRSRQLYDDAITLFERYLRNCSDSLAGRVYALIGAAHFSANRPADAVIALQKSIARDSTIIFAYRLLAASLKSSGAKLDEVIAPLRRGLEFAKSSDDRGLLYTLYCQVLLEERRFEQLRDVAQTWYKMDSGRADATLYLAVGYQGTGDRDSACKYYREALRLNPTLEVARKNLKQLECN
jgi:tetratricopeptide (TPR) repeat protein